MAIALAVHILAAVIWVGGMFFALMVLRPVSEPMPMEPRVTLWTGVLGRFFPWVWGAVVLLPATGYWMVFAGWGGLAEVGPHVHLMQGLGWTMIGLFAFAWLRPFQRARWMFDQRLIPEAGLYILRVRRFVILNLILGLIVAAAAASGRYW